MKSRNIILLVLLFSITTVLAQKDNCLEQVKSVYKAWKKQVQESAENTVYLKYEAETLTGDEKTIKNSSIVEVFSNRNNAVFLSPELQVYQDKKYTVSILLDKKLVVINGYVGDKYKQEKLGQFELLQDTIFNQLTTLECKKVVLDDVEYQRVTLKANSSAAKVYNINTIVFLINLNETGIKEVVINYVKGYRLKVMKTKILKQNLNYTATNFKKVALSNVLDSNGKLLNKYAGYKLMDNRK